MSDVHRIFGFELSPYSVKVRSYFRYKGIPHEWVLRGPATEPEYQKYAKIPIVPLVVTPGDEGLQDSTPILDRLEAEHPDPSVHPEDPTVGFLSTLLEEFGDEWGNKWMFHYRWARPVDADSAAGRIGRVMAPGSSDEQHAGVMEQIKKRMVNRVWFVGSNERTAPQIEAGFRAAIEQLDAHLAERPYLFGARPSYGDFGLWGQIYNAWTDPTPGALISAGTPNLLAWVHRMLFPRAEGDFESWSSLAPTLAPFLKDQVGGRFVPWTLANEACVAAGNEEFSVELAGETWTQKPQKYHAKSLAALRGKYAAVDDRSALDEVLAETGCLPAFAS
ncbi:MAG: glutathione S-transferase family protein [Myxococcales bacterium]|nr:glutathione S-transferase family protein [Myxococcales bacterium]